METCPLAKDGQGGPDQGDAETLLIEQAKLQSDNPTLCSPFQWGEVSKFQPGEKRLSSRKSQRCAFIHAFLHTFDYLHPLT